MHYRNPVPFRSVTFTKNWVEIRLLFLLTKQNSLANSSESIDTGIFEGIFRKKGCNSGAYCNGDDMIAVKKITYYLSVDDGHICCLDFGFSRTIDTLQMK